MGKRALTVKEIAEHVGVSIATVSRVTRGVDAVAPETRRRVLAAIEELGYRPSHLGQALVQRRHDALGIVFPGLGGPYYSEVIQGFEAEAVAARLSVLIVGTHQRGSDELASDMANRVDGIAIMGNIVRPETLKGLLDRGDPVVQLAGEPVGGVPTVRTESARAVEAVTRHLIEDHGYRDLAFVGEPTGSPDVAERWKGFLAAHERLGVRPPDEPVRVPLQQPGGSKAARRLLDQESPPRALVCANDESAIGALVTALGEGLRVPEDLALTGFDDIPMAELTQPGLTTVHQPSHELGERTARVLRQHIAGTCDPSLDLVLDTRVVRRASCGCTGPDPSTSVRT